MLETIQDYIYLELFGTEELGEREALRGEVVVTAADIAEESGLLRVKKCDKGRGGQISAGVKSNYPQPLTITAQLFFHQRTDI